MDLEKPYQDMLERAEDFQEHVDRETINVWYDLQSESVAFKFVFDWIDDPCDTLAKIIAVMANARQEIRSNRSEADRFKRMAYENIAELVEKSITKNAENIAESRMESGEYEQHEEE